MRADRYGSLTMIVDSPFPPPSGPPQRHGESQSQRPANPWWKQWYALVGAAVLMAVGCGRVMGLRPASGLGACP